MVQVGGEGLAQVAFVHDCWMVSVCTKSTARMAWAWVMRNWRQVRPDRRGGGSMPTLCRICQTVEAVMW